MFCFVKGTAGKAYKAPIVLITTATCPFGNVCADAIGSTDELFAHSLSGQGLPFCDNIPDLIGKAFGQLIDL